MPNASSMLANGSAHVVSGDQTTNRGKRNLDGLTSLRFFAAFAVVIYHFAGPGLAGWPAPLVNIAGSGFVAVSFFFILSGFVLSFSYLSPSGEMRGTIRSFYSARVARIYPAYLLGFLLAAPTDISWSLRVNHFAVAVGKLFFGGALVLALQQAWTPWTAWYWNFPSWSVSVEVFFYLVFPFIGWRIARLRPSRCVLVACGLWVLSLVAPFAYYLLRPAAFESAKHIQMAIEFTPIVRLPEFLIGVALGRIFSSGAINPTLNKALFFLSAATIFAVLSQAFNIPDPLLIALLIPLFAVVIYTVAEGALAKALSLPFLVLLGEASYGTYILQIPVAYVLHLPPPSPSLRVFVFYSATLLTVSVLSLRFIELPLRNRIRRFLDPQARTDRNDSQAARVDIVTCEYPPSLGGVADYTFKVVSELERRGCATRVWSPGNEQTSEPAPTAKVMRSFGRFGIRDIFVNERYMGSAKDRWLLLQWEPVGFGLQSLNLPFCLWAASRAWRGTRLVVMFHETFLPFNKPTLKRYVAGSVQRLMAFTLLNSAKTVFASNESGARALKRFCFRPDKVLHLPVFSNIEGRGESSKKVAALRNEFAGPDEALVGHFGRFMAETAPLVLAPVEELLRRASRVKILFIGECGARYRAALLAGNPELSSRVFDSGVGTSEEIAGLISACDLMFQPYPGGITTKRGSTMASLAQGRCVVSNRGPESERLWNDCAALRLMETTGPAEIAAELIRLTAAREELAERSAAAAAFYQKNFSLEHTVDAVLLSLGKSQGASARWLVAQ